ncbi:hypothetical protein pipiens_010096 [Culex pipiens pipiens]|uniref:Uncharacterized protein n=1 Tax=Culex pipiens pipiens TaxID=38569 RepID=A0ABD1DBE1_CULPP
MIETGINQCSTSADNRLRKREKSTHLRKTPPLHHARGGLPKKDLLLIRSQATIRVPHPIQNRAHTFAVVRCRRRLFGDPPAVAEAAKIK